MTNYDVSDASHGERQEHYRRQYGVYDLPVGERQPGARLAHDMATAEMLDEIHAMLRELIASSTRTKPARESEFAAATESEFSSEDRK